MSFIKVTANQCNQQGTIDHHQPPSEFYLNADLIGAIKNNEILLKGGHIVNIGGDWYKNIQLAPNAKIPTL